MRVLFVTERFPYPLDSGGNIRSFNVLKALAEEHEILLVSGDHGNVTAEQIEVLSQFCADVRLASIPRRTVVGEMAKFGQSKYQSMPFVLSRHFRPEIARIVQLSITRNSSAQQGKFARGVDAVHFNHLDAALYASAIPTSILRVLDQHNVVSNQIRTATNSERTLVRRVALRSEWRKLRRAETLLCNQMDLCLACSEADIAALRKLGVGNPLKCVPNGVDLEYFRADQPAAPTPGRIVFVGTLDYAPCENGVWYFCKEILPLVRREVPGATFVAVGRNPSARLEALARSDSAVQLTGRVEDVRLHVKAATVSVVPLLSGSGTRLKILEAMAMGVPIVTTAVGVEGIPVEDGVHVLIANSPPDFAHAVLRLIRSRELADRVRMAATSLVQSSFGWSSIRPVILADYRALDISHRAGKCNG